MRLLLMILLAASCVFAFDVERARDIINVISSEAYEGRRPGFRGGDLTEDYLAERFREYGVQQGGRSGYFQSVPHLITRQESSALTLMNHELGKIPFAEGIDYTLVTHSGSGSFVGKVVIAGMGYNRPDKDRDDYGDLDCRGKIVLIVRKTPDSPYSFGEDFSRSKTMAWAKERGAAAILWYYSPFPLNGPAIAEEDYDSQMPLFYVGDRLLRLLLDGSGYNQKTYVEALKTGPVPLETDYELWISAGVRKTSRQTSRNVLGIVYGSDPVLKNELIVVGAHMDHIGVNDKGVIYNGADDNASGTGVISELARSIASGPPLKRSVMFMHFTAEEDGLIGSRYWVENPTAPFGNITCMLNFDMVGAGNGIVELAGGHLLGKPYYDYIETIPVAQKERMKFYREDGGGSSDYAPFMEFGAPTISFWTDGGHPHYHNYEDDSAFLVDSVLANVGNRAESLIRYLGDYDGSLASRSDSVRNLARLTTTINLRGFFVDAVGTVPSLSVINAAWLPHDNLMPVGEIVARAANVHYAGKERDIETAGLKQALSAFEHDRKALFLSIPEAALAGRAPQDAITLLRQGLSLVSLTPGGGKAGGTMSEELQQILLDSDVYVEVPLDFATPARVSTWGDKSIVTTRVEDFAASPEEIRYALLNSDAMLILEITTDSDPALFESFRAGAQRRVHLNLGNTYPQTREAETKNVMRKLYNANYDRGDILLLTGGNLRRFFNP